MNYDFANSVIGINQKKRSADLENRAKVKLKTRGFANRGYNGKRREWG